MKKKFLVAIALSVMLTVCVVWILQSTGSRPPSDVSDAAGPVGMQGAEPSQKKVGGMTAAHFVGFAESPLMADEEGQQIYKELRKFHDLSERKDGVFYNMCEYKDMKRNMPMVELRFKKRNESGELRPVTIETVGFRRRIGRRTKSVKSACQFKGVPEVHTSVVRTIAGPSKIQDAYLIYGYRYQVQCKYREPDSGERVFYESIIKIPESIPDGKMAVIDVILKYSPEELDEMHKEPPISGRVTVPLPPTGRKWFAVYTHADDTQSGWTAIDEDGSFEIGEKDLGGMLRIAEKGGEGTAWMVVRSVQKRRLSLPEDADMHIRRDALKDVKLSIPRARISDAFVGVWLKARKDDTGPVAYKAFRSTSQAFERFKSSGIIPMQMPPGTYWVNAFYDPGEVDKREWKTLGRIEVPEELSDDVIPIETD